MSMLNKDDVIKACADGYRAASGTADLVPVGQLGELIGGLKAGDGSGESGAVLLESGEITVVNSITNAASVTRIQLAETPDLFVWYPKEDLSDTEIGATLGGVYLKADMARNIIPSTSAVTNLNVLLIRQAGYTTYNAAYNIANNNVYMIDNVPTARFTPRSSGYPIQPDTYYWESYKLWNGGEK